jgi:sugar lactone lactonase YvrE
MNRLAILASLAAVFMAEGLLFAADKPPCGGSARLLVVLPDCCNTPDGMSLQPDNSIIVSVPNFNDPQSPPLLIRVTPDNKAEVFYKFPTPYPGLPASANRIAPMGICRASSGDLYFADNQYAPGKLQQSRLWRLTVKHGKVDRMTLVASGFNVANGVTVHDGYVYITESILVEGFNPTLRSAVMRFKLAEQNVKLATPLPQDPHIVATFDSRRKDWGFGADGIAFDSHGNLFVGLFGEGEMYKLTFDTAGKLNSKKLFAKAPNLLVNCDGMSCDHRTDKLYVADSAANAIQVIAPNGRVTTLARNGEVTDKRTGQLDQPCEALVRGDTIVVSNMDWPFPGFINKQWQQPATLSVIPLP